MGRGDAVLGADVEEGGGLLLALAMAAFST
jgi:hypothetical protein